MHIVLVNRWYPPESGHGGVAMHNYYVANALNRLGHKVTVIAGRPSRDVPERRSVDGITVLRFTTADLYRARRLPVVGGQYRAVHSLLHSWEACRRLRDVDRQTRADVVEFADVNAEGFFWRQGLGRKLVVRCHTPSFVLERYFSRVEFEYPRLLGWMEKQAIGKAHVLTAPSDDMAQVIQRDCRVPPERLRVVPNALDTELFSPPVLRKQSWDVEILWVGRLERAKGLEVLAGAIPQVCRQAPSARFVFIGADRRRGAAGTHGEYLRSVLREQIASGRVEIRGEVAQSELVPAYRMADIAVVPAVLYESFSYTCAQAMACGLPVVASRIGGIPETLGHGKCGILVAPGDAPALADALVTLCRDRSLRESLGRAARERAVTAFSAGPVAQRMLAAYADGDRK